MVVKDAVMLIEEKEKRKFEIQLEHAIRNGWQIYPETFKILVSKAGLVKGYYMLAIKKYRTSSTGLKKYFGREE